MKDAGWSLREEVGAWVTQWYILVLAILIGGGGGWGAAFVFPADYEARAPLFVAFNSDALFTSPDDYKNAQFEEVTDLILSDAVLDDVLAGFEENLDRDDLRTRFSVQWRNAGRWDLVVRDRDPARAGQLAARWREAAFDQLSAALPHAQTLSQLDQKANLLARSLADVAQAQTRLEAIETGLRVWLEAGNDPVSEEERAELWVYAQEYLAPGGFPKADADREAYRAWANELLSMLEIKGGLLEAENQVLQAQMEAISEAWQIEKTASRGLSAYLLVELRGEVQVGGVRKPGVVMLVGGIVGGLGWIVLQLVRVARRGRNDG